MHETSQAQLQAAGSKQIKTIGRQAIGLSLTALVMTLIALVQMGYPPMGEIGNFTYEASFFVIPLSLWGILTGLGLTRAWRWARVSILLFGALLALFCALPALLFFAMPSGAIGGWELVGLRAIGLLFLIPPWFVVKQHLYFLGDEAKAYFQAGRQAPTASA